MCVCVCTQSGGRCVPEVQTIRKSYAGIVVAVGRSPPLSSICRVCLAARRHCRSTRRKCGQAIWAGEFPSSGVVELGSQNEFSRSCVHVYGGFRVVVGRIDLP